MKLTLYSTHCPQCVMLERILHEKGLTYDVVNDTSVMTERGFTTVPVLDADGKVMNFAEAVRWLNGGTTNVQ